MISSEDEIVLKKAAEKYNVSKLYLFGSITNPSGEASDIDVAVEGLDSASFFKFYSELLFDLSKPVDVIDLKKDSRFNRMVKAEGLLLYENVSVTK